MVGTLGAALTKGSTENAIACVKHFALNSAENKRFRINIICDEGTLHDCYLPHFRQCLEEGGGESLMTAYNKVNGDHCGENSYLLDTVVRSIWDLQDVVITSDWVFGFRDVPKSIKAGLDIEMPHRAMRAKHLPGDIARGAVSTKDVDQIGKRIIRMVLRYHARVALSETPNASIVRSTPHRQLAKEVAIQGTVVLQNDGILPLHTTKKLLVVGRLATSNQTGDGGSSSVLGEKNIVTPLQGLQQQQGVVTTHLDGTDLVALSKAIDNADAVLVIAGYTGEDEGEGGVEPEGLKATALSTVLPSIFPYKIIARLFFWTIFSVIGFAYLLQGKTRPRWGGDRFSLRLNKSDEKIITAVTKAAGKKTVLALEVSGPVILPEQVRSDAAAIIFTGYGGCEFGNALREVLFGDAEPSGRLAYSIPQDETDSSDIDLQAEQPVYGRFWGYRLLQQKQRRAAYPFGFGLGYSKVELVHGSLAVPRTLDQRFFDVTVSVRNVGPRETTHVVQVYAGPKVATSIDYQRALVGFARVKLQPGEECQSTIECRMDPVAHFNVKTRHFDVAKGDYNIFASSFEGDENSLTAVVPAPALSWSARVQREKK